MFYILSSIDALKQDPIFFLAASRKAICNLLKTKQDETINMNILKKQGKNSKYALLD